MPFALDTLWQAKLARTLPCGHSGHHLISDDAFQTAMFVDPHDFHLGLFSPFELLHGFKQQRKRGSTEIQPQPG